jgi:hypothetical protein
MEMRIVVPDAADATALAAWLTVALGSERIAIGGERPVVDVLIDGESDSAIARVVDNVVRWFDHARSGTVEMWLGARSYVLARWVPTGTSY